MKKYSRKIAALLPRSMIGNKKIKLNINKRYIVIYLKDFLFLVLAVQAFVFVIALFMLSQVYDGKKQEFSRREQGFLYWSRASGEHPNAPDVLFNAAKSAYDIGKMDRAVTYLNKALEIDPLFIEAQNLRDRIVK